MHFKGFKIPKTKCYQFCGTPCTLSFVYVSDKATAHLAGRDFVTPDDVQQVAFPVLAVRLDVEAADSRNLISQLLESVEAPTEPT